MELAELFWTNNRHEPRNAQRFAAAIHALFLGQNPQALQFEKFIYLYAAIDACYRLAAEFRQPSKEKSHAERIGWMCAEFGLRTPDWAKASAGGGIEVAAIRNDALHEDWRAHAGPVVQEASPFPLRRQTVADLKAAWWNLLAWEAPWLKQHGAPFWADAPMRDGRALDMGEAAGKTLRRVVVRCGATFRGLRLRDGALVLRVARGREAEQIWMADGTAFDPRRGGLEIAVPADSCPHDAWVLVERLDGTVFAR